MYSYAEIGNNNEIKTILNLPRRPRPDEIKKLKDGNPAMRPVVTGDYPSSDMVQLYEVYDPTFVVEPTQVVRNFKYKIRENYKSIIRGHVISVTHSARANALSSNELGGISLQVKMIMDEEAEEFLNSKEEDKDPERFPFVYACVGTLAETAEEVAVIFRKEFNEIKQTLATIEGEKHRLLKAIDRAETPDAVMRAFDTRSELFKR